MCVRMTVAVIYLFSLKPGAVCHLWLDAYCPPDDVTSCYTEDCLRSSSLATTAAMHLMYYTNDEGHRVYTLKVPPSPAAV